MTLSEILRGQGTEAQYEVMQRADRLLRGRAGRYFGGQLTGAEVATLTTGVKLRTDTMARVDAFVGEPES